LKHRGSDPAHPGWTRRYVYNETSQLEAGEVNNRLSATTIGLTTETYHYDGNAGLHGNMTAMPHLSSMQWDYKDQLRATSQQVVNNGGTPETTWYVYNAAGQRVRKVTERLGVTGQTGPTLLKERIYLGNFELYRKYSGDGSTVALERETLHITDSSQKRIALVETRTQGNEPSGVPARLVRYQLGNHLGSAVLELDDQAQIISYEEYYPYGSTSYQAVRSQIETPKRYRYTGKERDEENGLYYHGARYYASWLGRWTSCDPAGMVDGSNLYMYARDNPSVLTDPNGRQSSPQWQPVVVNNDENGKYYALEGTDVYRHDTKNYSEAWHEGGGDQVVAFAPDKITVPTIEKIVADTQKLDRPDFYLKYKDQFSPQQMQQVIQYVPIRPLTIPVEDTWTYMGYGGRVGTAEELARAEMANKLQNVQPPTVIGALYGIAATALGGDTQEAVRMMHVGDQVSSLATPVLAIGAMAFAGKGGGSGGSGTPPSPPPPSGRRLPIVNPHFEPTISPEDAFQGLTMNVYSKLNANRPLIADNLTLSQQQFSTAGKWAERIVFGNALENAMAKGAAPTGLLTHTGGIRPFLLGGADFTGAPGTPYAGLNFQLTTEKQYMRGYHVLNSPEGTLFGLYPGYNP
jgi:RHS repeat-associated protein